MKISCTFRAAALVAALMLAAAFPVAAFAAVPSGASSDHASTPTAKSAASGATGPTGASGAGHDERSAKAAAAHAGSSKSKSKGPHESFAAEGTPLNLGGSPVQSGHAGSGSSASSTIVRTIVGLFIVIAVIYGLAWILRQSKRGRGGRASGSGLTSVASLPLGTGRSLQLVRAGTDFMLVGVAEHGVTPIRRYTEEQARAAGLIAGEEPPADSDGYAVVSPSGSPTGDWRDLEDGGGFGARLIDNLRRRTVRS